MLFLNQESLSFFFFSNFCLIVSNLGSSEVEYRCIKVPNVSSRSLAEIAFNQPIDQSGQKWDPHNVEISHSGNGVMQSGSYLYAFVKFRFYRGLIHLLVYLFQILHCLENFFL